MSLFLVADVVGAFFFLFVLFNDFAQTSHCNKFYTLCYRIASSEVKFKLAAYIFYIIAVQNVFTQRSKSAAILDIFIVISYLAVEIYSPKNRKNT